MSATSDSDSDDILVVDITPASSCVSCRAGHNVHFIHARRGTERSTPHDVTVEVDEAARTVRLHGVDAGPQTWRNHDPGRLGDALRRSEGRAVWLPEYHLLRVPAARRSRRYLFNLARPDDWVPCLPRQEPDDRDAPPLQTAPGLFRPPRAGEDAHEWAEAVADALYRDWDRGGGAT